MALASSSSRLELLQHSPSSVSELGPLLKPGNASGLLGQQRQSTLWHVCPFILGNEFCERLAFYGVSLNLTTYIISVMGGSTTLAGISVSLFWGACFNTPVLGAFVADSYWGRYKTIMVSTLIYIAGLLLLVATATVPGLARHAGEEGSANAVQYSALAVALVTIALGTGGIKPNVSAFGADQFDVSDPQDALDKERFFGYFYMGINLGSLIAATTIVYVQDSVSWALGFAIPGVAMLLSLVLFVSGRKRYKHAPQTESPMTQAAGIIRAAVGHRLRRKRSGSDMAAAEDGMAASSTSFAETQSLLHGDMPPTGSNRRGRGQLVAACGGGSGTSDALRLCRSPPPGAGARGKDTDGGSSHSGEECDAGVAAQRPGPSGGALGHGWVQDAVTLWQQDEGGSVAQYTTQQVEDVRLVLRVMPVFLATIPYWTVYAAMGSFFVQQGNLMQRNIHLAGRSLLVPAASLNVFCTGAVLLFIPLYLSVIEPLVQHWSHKITMLQRIGTGMVLITAAMLSTCVVEAWRLHLIATQSNEAQQVAELSIFWQVFQYSLTGASEVFTAVGMLEFFYDQAPDTMRSSGVALSLLSIALGGYVAGVLVALVQALTSSLGQPWLPRDLNQGRLDLFFLLQAAIMVLATLAFIFVARRFEYRLAGHSSPEALGASDVPHTPSAGTVPDAQHADATGSQVEGGDQEVLLAHST